MRMRLILYLEIKRIIHKTVLQDFRTLSLRYFRTLFSCQCAESCGSASTEAVMS